jgi:uncharacterized protein (DUF58 family)
VNGSATLIPASVTASAQPFKRLNIAFGPRFFLLLLMGFVWVGPAFAEPRFLYAMLVWDGLAVAAWVVDLSHLPRPQQIAVTRSWTSPAALSVPTRVELTLHNHSGKAIRARILDNVPVELRLEAPDSELIAEGHAESSVSYGILPRKRGDASLGSVYIRYQSPLRIAECWAAADLKQDVCVYPNLREAQQHSIYLIRSRQIDLEKRYSRRRGMGREFESLREYREGDDFGDICWSATARRGKLITRLYQIERSQTIWLAVDCGRLMRTEIAGLSKLDYAVNAALSLAQVALGSGDRVGLLAYGQKVRHRVFPYRGSAHLRQLMDRFAVVREESAEADHLQAASTLLSSQKRRSLIVWLTDLAETAMTPEVIEAVGQMMSRHLVVFVVIGQPDLGELANQAPASVSAMYLTAAAQELTQRREVLLAKLRQHGVHTVEVSSSRLSTAVVNTYLELKGRSQL